MKGMKTMLHELEIRMLPGEAWWGGLVNCGWEMPLTEQSCCTVNPFGGEDLDQGAALFLSSRGRCISSGKGFVLSADAGVIRCRGEEEIRLEAPGKSLRDAYLAASQRHFPFSGKLPDERFFSRPQYNTWIELGTNQTTEAILTYARSILADGLPAGILMIDEGWQEEYGVFEFNRRKIPNPGALMDELHAMGFSVMLWVTPNIACAGPRFRELCALGYLLRDAERQIALRAWWNGYSAVLDLTNDGACAWLHAQLRSLMERYGVDGFKFDAGDRYFYRDDDATSMPTTAREHTTLFNRIGEAYVFNEFRSAWNYGGRPIVARLQDKKHCWGKDGLSTLIPHTIVQGLLGYAYCCPDMVGGGEMGSFEQGQPIDGELFVRWAQASACMGMMQMSISPWRVLPAEQAKLVSDAIRLHASLAERICALAEHAAKTGEPIVRHMAYVFPDEGFETVSDQFMLGDTLLVCPVLKKGAAKRRVRLPAGRWAGWRGECFEGPANLELDVTLADLPRFERL